VFNQWFNKPCSIASSLKRPEEEEKIGVCVKKGGVVVCLARELLV